MACWFEDDGVIIAVVELGFDSCAAAAADAKFLRACKQEHYKCYKYFIQDSSRSKIHPVKSYSENQLCFYSICNQSVKFHIFRLLKRVVDYFIVR